MKNYRNRQTYYGAVDLLTQELWIKKAKTDDRLHTVNLMKYLQSRKLNSHLLII